MNENVLIPWVYLFHKLGTYKINQIERNIKKTKFVHIRDVNYHLFYNNKTAKSVFHIKMDGLIV